MVPLAAGLLEQDPGLRVIAIGGDNPGLVARLGEVERQSAGRLRVFGFTDRVAELLAASDLLVTKPGPASLSEAWQLGVPVVVVRNLHTIPQERFNTELVARRGLGLVVSSARAIPGEVTALRHDPERLAALRRAVAEVAPNRAVYEVLDVVARAAESSRN
jgi:UDP-N-acetylglucosamine:LPS N-acetylglucosamine transferase